MSVSKTLRIDFENNEFETSSLENKKDEAFLGEKPDKFYLPVLNLNQEQHWPSKPVNERKHFTDDVAYDTCLGNCCGHEGLKAGCCQIDVDDLEHVLGPIDEDWIKNFVRTNKKNGNNISRQDVVIDFEEGKLIGDKFFNGHEIFKQKTSYPMFRFQIYGHRFICKYLNASTKKCEIYLQRPNMCASYICQYVKTNFLVKPQNSNTYMKIR